ncbi:MAG: SIMPL domain-containing protein [candidate division WWE3 bacterium]|nr:SIMPL domain-containing protein [candidate division WWE3 bacterium]
MEIRKLLTAIVFVVVTALVVVASLFVIRGFRLSLPLSITNLQAPIDLAVVGIGKVTAVPDVAYVDAGIVVNAGNSVAEVQSKIDAVNNAILAAVEKLGIAKADVTTSNYSITPNYNYSPTGQNSIDGYNGNAAITIKVKDLSRVSSVIAEAATAGANQVNGARFEISDPNVYRAAARDQAISNAKLQAQKLAASLGLKLGKVTNIVESNSTPVPYPMMYGAGVSTLDAKATAPQIEVGTQEVSSTVTLYFEKQ